MKILGLTLTKFKVEVFQAFKDAVPLHKRGSVRFLTELATGLSQIREDKKGDGSRRSQKQILASRAKMSAAGEEASGEEVVKILSILEINSLKLVATSLGVTVPSGTSNLADVQAAVKSGCAARMKKRKADLWAGGSDDEDEGDAAAGGDEGGGGSGG
jgi:hypothetical protein